MLLTHVICSGQIEVNRNVQLLKKYLSERATIAGECTSGYKDYPLMTAELGSISPCVTEHCNEWRLLHGASREACAGICQENSKGSATPPTPTNQELTLSAPPLRKVRRMEHINKLTCPNAWNTPYHKKEDSLEKRRKNCTCQTPQTSLLQTGQNH